MEYDKKYGFYFDGNPDDLPVLEGQPPDYWQVQLPYSWDFSATGDLRASKYLVPPIDITISSIKVPLKRYTYGSPYNARACIWGSNYGLLRASNIRNISSTVGTSYSFSISPITLTQNAFYFLGFMTDGPLLYLSYTTIFACCAYQYHFGSGNPPGASPGKVVVHNSSRPLNINSPPNLNSFNWSTGSWTCDYIWSGWTLRNEHIETIELKTSEIDSINGVPLGSIAYIDETIYVPSTSLLSVDTPIPVDADICSY